MDNIIYPFPLPIYQDFVNEESFKVIKKDTYNFIYKNKDLFKQPWENPTLTTCYNSKDKNIQSKILENQIKKHVENYFKIWKFNKPTNLKIKEIWINIAPKEAYQEEHNHGSSLFSGVLYINTTKSMGNIEFQNPLTSESILLGSPKEFDYYYNIQPENGMLLLFPGWLIIEYYLINPMKIEYQYHLI